MFHNSNSSRGQGVKRILLNCKANNVNSEGFSPFLPACYINKQPPLSTFTIEDKPVSPTAQIK